MSDKKSMAIHAAELKLLELYESDKLELVNRSEMETLRLYRKAIEAWAALVADHRKDSR